MIFDKITDYRSSVYPRAIECTTRPAPIYFFFSSVYVAKKVLACTFQSNVRLFRRRVSFRTERASQPIQTETNRKCQRVHSRQTSGDAGRSRSTGRRVFAHQS